MLFPPDLYDATATEVSRRMLGRSELRQLCRPQPRRGRSRAAMARSSAPTDPSERSPR
jgi:hypothetical protein